MTDTLRGFDQRIEILVSELNRSQESACLYLDRALLDGPSEGGFPARYWAREIAVLRGALVAIEDSRRRIYSAEIAPSDPEEFRNQ